MIAWRPLCRLGCLIIIFSGYNIRCEPTTIKLKKRSYPLLRGNLRILELILNVLCQEWRQVAIPFAITNSAVTSKVFSSNNFARNWVFKQWTWIFELFFRWESLSPVGSSSNVNLSLNDQIHKFQVFCLQVFYLLLWIFFVLDVYFILGLKLFLKVQNHLFHIFYLSFKFLPVLDLAFLTHLQVFSASKCLFKVLLLCFQSFFKQSFHLVNVLGNNALHLGHRHIASANLVPQICK